MSSNGVHPRDDDGSDENQPRKRNRPGLSCHGCRRRKYRCDGRRPTCMPCERSKIPCIYDADLAPGKASEDVAPMPVAPTAPAPRPRLKSPARQPQKQAAPSFSQTMQAKPPPPAPLVPYEPARSTAMGVTNEELTYVRDFRGKGFKTQFCGFTHSGSLFCDFTQLLVYSKQFMDRHPMLLRAHMEMRQRDKASQNKYKAGASSRNARPLYSFLPSQEQTTQFVNLYLETLEQCFHIIHVPTFNEQFKKLWEHELAEAPESVVATVLLMCASVMCCSDEAKQSYTGSVSFYRSRAESFTERVDVWFHAQSQKHTTLAYFQNRFLLLIARSIIGAKVKRFWCETGLLYRFAICSGLHLDTTTARLGSRISPFDREMRRRIWAAIEDLDLAATIHRGVCPAMCVTDSDCGAPTNIDDEQLDEGVETIPTPLKLAHYYPISPLIVSRQTYAVRRDITAFLNSDAATNITQADLLQHEGRLLSALSSIPTWPASSTIDPSAPNPGALPRALQRSELLELLMLLHQRAYESPAAEAHRHYARQGRLSAAAALIRGHNDLPKASSILLVCLRGDVFQAAMSICFDMCEPDPRTDALMISRPPPAELCDLVERALDVLEMRIDHVVGVLKRYWLLGCAHSLVRRLCDPENADRHEANAGNRIGGVLYKQLSLQVDPEQQIPEAPLKTSATPVGPAIPLDAPTDYNFSFDDLPNWEVDLNEIDMDELLGL